MILDNQDDVQLADPKFDAIKMKRLVEKDSFLSWQFERMKPSFVNEETRLLEILFNEHVLDDSVFTALYLEA